jgi:hypothetical protein
VVPVLLRLTRFGHSAHQGGSISPLIIFTTCDASANSVAAIAKVTLIRLSLGRAISIDNFFGTKSMRRNKNDRSIFRHAFRYSTNCHMDLRIAFASRDKGCQGHRYLARLRTWLGSSRHRRRQKWIRSWRENACFPSTTRPKESLSRSRLI